MQNEQNDKHRFPECRKWCTAFKPKTEYCEDYIEQYGLLSVQTMLCDNESADCFIRKMDKEYKKNQLTMKVTNVRRTTERKDMQ